MRLPKREPHLEYDFPNLREGEYEITGRYTPLYNCVSLVNNQRYRWDYPSPTTQGLIRYFELRGWQKTDNAQPEEGLTKMAIYVGYDGEWSHVCIQTKGNKWLSKLGDSVEILHEKANALAGADPAYGFIQTYMMRPRKPDDP